MSELVNIFKAKRFSVICRAMIIIITLFFAYSSKADELQPKRSIIAGKVENMLEKSTVILVNLCNPLSEEIRVSQDLTVSDGTFHVVHDYVFAQNLTVRYDNFFINFYITPGDSVFLTIDGHKLQQHQNDAVAFSGDQAQINEQLFQWTNYAYRSLTIPEFNPNDSPSAYLQNIKQHFNTIQDTINAYAQRNAMNDFVKRWALIDYKFLTANYLLDYKDKASRWNVFTDSIFDVYNEANFQSMYFIPHVSTCAFALADGNNEIREQLQQKNYSAALRTLMKELPEKAPEGTVRDMIFYQFAHSVMDKEPELYDSIPELKSFFSQVIFKEKLASFAREKTALAKKPLPLTEKTIKGVSYLDNDRIVELPDIELMSYLLDRYKNKVLYIDVWATWCGPCLEEMKHAPALHKHFAEKEVVFVNLCLESTPENWSKTINKSAIKGENYYLDENLTKIFMGTYNISGFPTYMLIDKDGQFRAPVARPSNMLSVIKQIEKAL
jgi:thiol-disulfide isomerase/thioredoxin